MLTVIPEATEVTLPRSVRIDVAAEVVRLALRCAAQDAGWTECSGESGCRCVVVSDRPPRDLGEVDVLVTQDVPAACQGAVDALMGSKVRAIVLWNEPAGLADACEAVRRRLALLPQRVVELAVLAPRLNVRQRDTLRLLAMGRSSWKIGVALHQSESTAKRDIADLLVLFDAPNRTALVSAAALLGFVPHPGGRAPADDTYAAVR